ncbi:glycosyltransferase family 2 protein [Paenibacillus lautus]|uniref:glycosyltransferase family 2 protein n=1 Tax=Paenibacillus lautus TaxID=1401 RepID=UPI003D27A7B2
MEKLDIILVSYNSEKWIPNLLKSLEEQNYPLKKLHLTFVDNNSKDNSRVLIESYQNKNLFGGYHYHFLKGNIGFGRANNYGVNKSEQKLIFFLNIDTEVHKESIVELIKSAESVGEDVALWESRQFPYEHPKVYNPVSMETTWSSGACCMVRRDYFEQVGMFDEKIFMYGEDVDLSWRFRAHGYKLIYVPKSIVHHYTYMSAGEVKPNQFYNSTYMNLMLRYKFGHVKDIVKGYAMYLSLLAVKGPSESHKKNIFKRLTKSIYEGMKYRQWYRKNKNRGFYPGFKVWDYEINRDGAFYINEIPTECPLVSLLIRTCGRPNVLREALISVRNQTYPNIEVVIIEDGLPLSQRMIQDEFSDLNIMYKFTNERVGRCHAGNLALESANGEYLNFLDDDDLLYADHVEVLVNQLTQNPGFKAGYAIAFEVPTEILSNEPYKYEEKFHNVLHRQQFNRLILLHHNYFPIQTVMFKKEVFNELGGIDVSLEVLEDWDLWLRYALKYDFLYVEKLTSLYRVPAKVVDNHRRQELFDKYLPIVREKHFSKKFEVATSAVFKDAEFLLNKPPAIIYQRIKRMSFRTFVFKLKNKTYHLLKKYIS